MCGNIKIEINLLKHNILILLITTMINILANWIISKKLMKVLNPYDITQLSQTHSDLQFYNGCLIKCDNCGELYIKECNKCTIINLYDKIDATRFFRYLLYIIDYYESGYTATFNRDIFDKILKYMSDGDGIHLADDYVKKHYINILKCITMPKYVKFNIHITRMVYNFGINDSCTTHIGDLNMLNILKCCKRAKLEGYSFSFLICINELILYFR